MKSPAVAGVADPGRTRRWLQTETPALRFALVLPVDPIFTRAITRTDRAGVSAGANNRYRC